MSQEVQLKRSISFPVIIFYGIGTILGAGIYALIGKVAGEAGMYAPIAFLISGIVAAFSAFTYAEFSSRVPKAAGSAAYVKEWFHSRILATITGLAITLSGIVSAATLSRAFSGYFTEFMPDAPTVLVILGVLIALTLLAIKGIKEASWFVVAATTIELFGLFLIVWVSKSSFGDFFTRLPEMIPTMDMMSVMSVSLGAFLAFYAFIGFEDMVSNAEEIKDVKRNLPRAILLALGITTCIYVLISVVAVLSLSPQDLANHPRPLAYLYEVSTGQSGVILSVIALFAIINGALAQIIMGSRVLFGMAQKQWLPKQIAYIYPKTQTPLVATILVAVIIAVLSLSFDLTLLAKITSFITLAVFTLIHSSLVLVKLSEKETPDDIFSVSIWIPIIGAITNTLILGYQLYLWLGLGIVLSGGH